MVSASGATPQADENKKSSGLVLKKTPYRIAPLTRIVLLKLYVEHVNDNPLEKYTVDDVCHTFSVPVSRNLIATALERLYKTSPSQRLVSAVGRRGMGSNAYRITDDGILFIEQELRNDSSDLAHYFRHGDGVLDEVAGFDGVFWTQEEIADDVDWQPVNFDKDSSEYLDAMSALDEAIDVAEASNEFGAEFPEEKKGILNSLRQGREWLAKSTPSRAQIKALLLDPLRWLASAFGNNVLGEVAKRAAQKLVDLIGSVFF